MAWIVKNSAGMEVERREAPYLDDALRKRLTDEVLPKYPTKRAATLPVLHAVQNASGGHLPYQAFEEIAEFLGQTPAAVLDTATFYDQFNLEPVGKYIIWLCQSLSCELLGEPRMMQKLRDKLGIDAGQTTDDGRFTLRKAECLGSCGTAPCCLVNDALHENLTEQNLDEILDGLD